MIYDKRWGAKPAVTEEPWRDLVRRAADLIEMHGLAKHTTRDADGRMCIRGALMVACGWPDDRGDLYWGFAVAEARDADLAIARHVGCQDLPYWNNVPERTKEEVVAALRAAAAN